MDWLYYKDFDKFTGLTENLSRPYVGRSLPMRVNLATSLVNLLVWPIPTLPIVEWSHCSDDKLERKHKIHSRTHMYARE